MKPLDIVKTYHGNIAIVTQSQVPQEWTCDRVTIQFIGPHPGETKTGWYNETELTLIDSLPLILAKMATKSDGADIVIPGDYYG